MKTYRLLPILILAVSLISGTAFSQCTNGTAYATATAPSTPSSVTISTCQYQTEYSTVNGIQAGADYISNYTIGGVSDGCITVHSGTPGGPIVAWGMAPLAWTATVAGTYYIHYNDDCGCTTSTGCGVSTIECLSCTITPVIPPGGIPISTGGTISACTGTFFDSGGTANYNYNENYVITFCAPTAGDQITVDFTGLPFGLQANNDVLFIYDGTGTGGTALWTSIPGNGLVNPGSWTSTTGCLTFEFVSDGVTINTGWEALISCASCSDGIQNGNETGIDCGGPTCVACPNCFNGIQDGNETGIDCGPSCPEPCHCGNGILDGDETDIDCGGSCAPCPVPCEVQASYTTTPVQGGCCDYQFNLYDSFGDGWNGASVSLNGTPYTFTTGSSQLNTITMCDGDAIDIDYTASGTYASEVSFELIDADGNVVFASGSGPVVTNNIYVGTAQCMTPGVLDCNGGDITLTAAGQGEYNFVLNNDFEMGPAGSGWNTNITADFTNPCDPSVDGGTYMWMGNSAPHPRIIETIPLDLSCGGEVCFFLDFATQGNASPCEGIDVFDEGVYFEYSIDGGTTWITMEYYGPAGVGNTTQSGGTDPQMTAWNQYCLPIPPGAETPNTLFHWAQTGSSGLNNDHWGLDNVTISSLLNCDPYVYDWNQVAGTDDNPIQFENVTSTTNFTVWYGNGTDSCFTDVLVVIPPGTTADAGPDQVLCQGASGGVTIGADPICLDEGATYLWSTGASGTIDLSGGGQDNGQIQVAPAVTTTYYLEVTFNGCTAYDTVVVTVDVPPTGSNPATVNVQCSADIPPVNVLDVIDEADDFTLPPTVTHVGDVSDNLSCPETITRTYRITDGCGNFIDVDQLIIINDTQVPVMDAPPAAVTVQCVGDVPAMTDLGWTDNCDGTGTVTGTDGPQVGTNCGGTITRSWTYTDNCGNVAATVTQVITINDNIAPVMAAPPAGVTVQCVGDVPAMTNLGYTDNCDAPGTVAGSDGPIVGGNCGGTITRTWTWTDACGNVSTPVTQIITINDNIAPVMAAPPAAVNVQCAGDVPAMTNLGYTDNCDAPGTVAGSDVSDNGSCPETITRTWTWTDACGNTSAAVTQIITIHDTQVPVFAAPPADVTVECPGDVPTMTDLGWTDNCDGANTVTGADGPLVGGPCGGTITRTWTYTDACGNTATVTQTITVDDTTPPTASAPAPISVAGIGAVPPANILDVIDEADNCTVNPVVVWVGDVSDNGNCPEIITRTYSITDDCGNTITVDQIITVGDAIFPTASNPAPMNVECIGDVLAPDVNVVTDEADNGNTPTVTWEDDTSDNGSCPETILRRYRVTDDCGNFIFVTQTITVMDVTPPVLALPLGALIVDCIGDVPVMTDMAWTDNCDGAGTVTGTDVSDNGSCPEIITRTWTYTDICGNTTSVSRTFTVHDLVAPVFAAPPADVSVQCPGDVPAMTDLGYTDNCDAAGTVTGTDGALIGGPCGGTITRTWTYTDACGNVATVTQTITVDDTTPPTASAPAPISVAGIGAVPPANILDVIDEADNCTVNPVVVWVGDVSDNGNCPEIITRSYSITDDCGNTITVDQIITVGDAIFPTASDPLPMNVECIGDVLAPDPNVVTDETDNGGAPIVTWEDDTSDNGSCPETIDRRYRVTDNCGNFIFVTQTITVMDITAPVMDAPPAAVAVQCIGDVPTMTDLGYTDNCDAAGTVTGTDVSDNGSCPETITRTWTYTDICGNVSTPVTQIITVHDTQAPVFVAPPVAANVQCIGDVPAMTDLAYTDNCDAAGTVTGTDVSDNGSCPETITRTWTYTDACGNTSTEQQIITVHDTQVPVFAAPPADVTVECVGDVPAMTDLGWTDNCDGANTITGTDGVLTDPCGGTITRTWTYTDACGNTATVIQTITVDDTTPPTASNPATTTVPGGPAPVVDINVVIDEADNCTLNPVVAFVSESSDNNPCPETITRIYSVTDDCGNTINVTHIILITDPFLPTASNPLPIDVECIGDVPAPDVNVVTDEADNQGVPTVAWVSDVSDNGSCPEIITRTYSVTDLCGGAITVEQTITVLDITAPVMDAPPAAVAVQCIGDVPAMTDLGYTDNCDAAGTVTGTDVSDNGSCPETITRTWTYTDICGNVSTPVTQIITVHDTQAPVFSAPPAAVAVQCIGDVPAMTDLGYTDNCDPAGTVTGADVSDNGSCPETITRTWTFTDACGNTSTEQQIITVHDTQVPVFAAPPAAVSVQCVGDIPAMTDLGWTDNCDGAGTVTGTDGALLDPCGGSFDRTWTYTDACGNVATVTQTITVDDTTPPTASNPATTTVPGGPAPAVDINAVIDEADNCTLNPVVAFVSESSDNNPCPETITRIYSVTDDCGNTINVTHLIVITDPIMPTGTAPGPVTVECIGDVPAADPLLITDEADNQGVPVVAWVGDVSDNGSCPEIITRTYSITDICGNVVLVDQLITVMDITDPTATAPATVNVECIGDVPAWNILDVTTEADNCTLNPVVAWLGDMSDNGSCPETITRTYSITDDCGNQITVDQLIIVNDITPPTATAPATVNVECIADVPAANIADITNEADNCTLNPVVVHVGDVSDNGSCPETITRTYSITDDCGNQITVDQLIIVNDITPPTASNPVTVNVECIGDVPLDDITVVTNEADNCTLNPVVAFVGDVSNNQSCPETITRTYSVTDDCGNQITVDQLIIVHDVTDPTATAPATVNVECIGDVPAWNILDVTTEADNCTLNPVVAWVGDVSDNGSCPETITRTYSITDDCGNQITVDQLIIVNDVTNPTATAPATVNVECIGDVPAANILDITNEADNCTVNPVVAHVGDVSDNGSCPETITRTYSITDDCGNQITVDQLIIVNDVTPPTATAPAQVNVECIGDVPAANILDITNEADNCTVNPIVVHVGDVSDGLSCPETITRTYSITDDCGNTITVDQTIVVNDITPPTASNPLDIDVPGAMDVPAPDPLVVTNEADNCTLNPVVAWVSDVSDGNVCNLEKITRTYSVTDDCGNQILVTQIITILAVPAPIDAGPDQTICEGDLVTIVADNPWNVPIVWNPVVPNGPFNPGQTTTYTVTADNLGCLSTDDMTVIVEPLPTVSFMGDVLSGCEPLTVNFTNTSSAPSGLTNCEWLINGQTISGCGTVSYTFENGGTYDVTLTTTSGTGCTNSTTYTDYIYVEDTPLAAFSPSTDHLTTMFTEVDFVNNSVGAVNYEWDFGDGTSSTLENPSNTFPIDEGAYVVELIALSPLGCSDTAYAVINIVEELIFYVPNSFTPDGDNYNEYFTPVFTSGYDPYDFEMLIFNRWGEIIWESHDASVGWDGTYGAGQKIVQDGTFTWRIEFKTSANDKRMVVTGHVNIIK